MKGRVLLLAFVTLSPPMVAAEIFRCVAPSGGVTYQEIPCIGSHAESRTAIPSEFPPVNEAERNRLFAREAALDSRLEARRERDTRELLARAEREAETERVRLALAEAAAAQSQFAVAYPAYSAYGGYGRPRPAPRAGNARFYGPPTQLIAR
jgi:hypothetical protein